MYDDAALLGGHCVLLRSIRHCMHHVSLQAVALSSGVDSEAGMQHWTTVGTTANTRGGCNAGQHRPQPPGAATEGKGKQVEESLPYKCKSPV